MTWNAAHLLPECLDALLEQTVPAGEFEVVVVDNASTDDTAEVLQGYGDRVRTVTTDRNRGFAGGANAGIRAARAPVVVLVNNDATVAPDFLERVLAPIEQDTTGRLAAVTARIELAGWFAPAAPTDPDALQDARGRAWVPVPEGAAGATRLLNSTGNEVTVDGNGRDRDWLAPVDQGPAARDVFGFCGGAAAVRRDALVDVGLFDEAFFLYYEDTDVSWRVRRRGWHVVHEPTARVQHLHQASSGRNSDLFRYHNERNRLAVLTKNAPVTLLLRGLTRYLVRTAIELLSARAAAGLRVRVLRDWVRWLPVLWRERRDLDRASVVPARDLRPWFVPAVDQD